MSVEIVIGTEQLTGVIHTFRGERVMLDSDLARLYGVATKNLIKAVHRNPRRFPPDFMFQLTDEEFLRFTTGTSKPGRGGRRYRPYVFTEQGVGMLASVLRSDRAADVNVELIRAFVRLRQLLASNAQLERKLEQLEKKYDASFRAVFDAFRKLMAPEKPRRTLGFGRKGS